VWGDDQYVCVVETSTEGKATATQVFRLGDGAVVKAPEFAAAYDQRLRLVARSLLIHEAMGKDETRLHLYDPVAGKDVWTTTLPARARLLSTLDEELTGFVARDGKVLVLDARSGKERLKAEMDAKHFDKVVNVHVFADDKSVYVACENAPEAAATRFSPVNNGTGMRSFLVNGELYAFDAATGKERWHHSVPGQFLLVDPTGALPVLLLASREVRMGGI